MINKINRRDVLKLLGLGGAGLFVINGENTKADTRLSIPASHKNAQIVIVGGGAGGMAATARVRRAAPNAKITLVESNITHLYEAGQIFVAAGLYKRDDIKRSTASLLPDNVVWLQEKVVELDPQNSSVTLQDSGKIGYDFLIVALDAEYDYHRIDGLTTDMIGKNGIASVYLNNTSKGIELGGESTQHWFNQMYQTASRGPIKILCTEPDTLIKERGTSLDVLFLGNDILRGNGPDSRSDITHNTHFTFLSPDQTLITAKSYDNALRKIIAKADNIDTHHGQTLIAIDSSNKLATFSAAGEMTKQQLPYDFIHITPPMQAPDVLRNSPLAVNSGKNAGWMDIDEKTLLHPKFHNVIGIGNTLATKAGRTTGSMREQAIVIQDNIAALLEGQKPTSAYDGYTASRIKTRFGRELLAEFNNEGAASSYGLNPYKPRWIWWATDLYTMPWIYFNLMMRGMY